MQLVRWAAAPTATLGRLGPLATIELPWRDNQVGRSSIPPGVYRCQRRFYHKGGYETFEVMDVPGRSHILFHVANIVSDLRGCIGIGQNVGVLSGRLAVMRSRFAFRRWMDSLEGIDEFVLHIVEY